MGRYPDLATARTGTPINITISRKAGRCRTATLPAASEPGAGASIYAANAEHPDGLVQPLAFSTPANGTWGNLGRYIASGPNNYEIDTGLQKRFRLTEKLNLSFRASAFNLLNNPQWTNPSEATVRPRVSDRLPAS